MESRRSRELDLNIVYETHHVLMKSMGGTNDPSNLVKLTPREHFLAHWLLWRIHRNRQTARAFFSMKNWSRSGRKISSSRGFQEAKEAVKRLGMSDETRARMSNAFSGRKYSLKTRERMAVSARSRVRVSKRNQKMEICANCGVEFLAYEDSRNLKARYCTKQCSQKGAARIMRETKSSKIS